MECLVYVDLGKDLRPKDQSQDFINTGQGVTIFFHHGVQPTVINAEPQCPVRLPCEQDWGSDRCRARGYISCRAVFLQNTLDRKSTRLNSSHLVIAYAVFCLKKKR